MPTKTMPAKGAAAKISAEVKPFRQAEPPPDNPLLRHRELSLKSIVAEQGEQPALTAAAMMAGGSSFLSGAIARRAQQRLEALRESSRMPSVVGVFDPPTANILGAAAPAALSGAGISLDETPAATGVISWSQMGPTATPGGQTSGNARVLVTGRVTAVVVDQRDPQTIYIGTAQGGVWRTTDGGKNWSPKSDNQISLAIGALAVDPDNNRVLYAGTGEGNFSLDSYYGLGVLKSEDMGETWAALATEEFSGARFCRIAVTPGASGRVFAATSHGLYRSTDGGMNWKQMGGPLPAVDATDVVIDPTTPATVYAAFYGLGLYKTTNAGAASPTWAKLSSGLPTGGFARIALGMSSSSSQVIYALMSAKDHPVYTINRLFRTTDGGASWKAVPLPGGNIGRQGFYNLHVAVDPATPDIVYMCGVSVWKATRNAVTDTWAVEEIGTDIHPDNHALAFDPTNHLVLYAGNDGGIYKSEDGGKSWSDKINEGLCIMQFEVISQHPDSDALVVGGTQDNGIAQFRNSPVFYHSDDGDGGFIAIDQSNPRNILGTYYGNSPKRSSAAGKFGTWADVSDGVEGGGLFYPPMVLNDIDQNQVAFGTSKLNLDPAQGTASWPVKVDLPGIDMPVSAIHYVNSALIYVGTASGQVYRVVNDVGGWIATAIHVAPLPSQPIMDLAARPDDHLKVLVVFSEFDIPHVWRGDVSTDGTATWTDVSGDGNTRLPNAPVNAIVIDPSAPDTYYVGADTGVYRTTNGGATWARFGTGLPNCAVFDMRLHNPTRLLRVATHGRGMWERRLDGVKMPAVDVFVRDHLMDTGRLSPSPDDVAAAFADPLHHVALGDRLWHWMCADIKVDAPEGATPAYQMDVADVDYVAFEHVLEHRRIQPGKVNRVYAQLHNRGYETARAAIVKLVYTNASAGLPPLPSDFWSIFPDSSSDVTFWKPVGPAKVVPSLSPGAPVVLEWDWAAPADATDHSCLLLVVDSTEDPIPEANKVFDVDRLVRAEKRVGLKSMMVSTAPAGATLWTTLDLHSAAASTSIRIHPSVGGASMGLLLPKTSQPRSLARAGRAGGAKSASAGAQADLEGFAIKRLPKRSLRELRNKIGDEVEKYDYDNFYVVENAERGGRLKNIRAPKKGVRVLLLLTHPADPGERSAVSIVQEADDLTVGGSTILIRAAED